MPNSRLRLSLARSDTADHDVGVHHVVDQRNVLVADALDIVLAIAVVEHGRAFQRLDGGDLRAVPRLEIIAGGNGAGRASRRHESREFAIARTLLECCENLLERRAGAGDNGSGNSQNAENWLRMMFCAIALELRAFVVDLLDVAFGAGVRMMSAGSATHFSSQSKRSRLMPAGSTATPRQPRMREIATPPRQ